ncbi:MAG: hypothetical protein WBP65_19440 [Candidatus Sulfotelmatobacter sp.]
MGGQFFKHRLGILVISGIRKLVPYRCADVSPYERPLTDKELTNSARNFVILEEGHSIFRVLKDGAKASYSPQIRSSTRRLLQTDTSFSVFDVLREHQSGKTGETDARRAFTAVAMM